MTFCRSPFLHQQQPLLVGLRRDLLEPDAGHLHDRVHRLDHNLQVRSTEPNLGVIVDCFAVQDGVRGIRHKAVLDDPLLPQIVGTYRLEAPGVVPLYPGTTASWRCHGPGASVDVPKHLIILVPAKHSDHNVGVLDSPNKLEVAEFDDHSLDLPRHTALARHPSSSGGWLWSVNKHWGAFVSRKYKGEFTPSSF